MLRGTVEAARAARTDGTLTHEALERIEADACAELAARGWKPDYITLRRQRDLHVPTNAELVGVEPLVVLGAARLGTPRLLDNVEV